MTFIIGYEQKIVTSQLNIMTLFQTETLRGTRFGVRNRLLQVVFITNVHWWLSYDEYTLLQPF